MSRRSFKSLFLVALGLLVFTAVAYPQKVHVKKSSMNNPYFSDRNYTEKQFTNFMANLSVAIQSENLGLRKSAVYLAGLYSLNEVVPTLVTQLERENNSDVKILIALALYRMGDAQGMEAVEKLYGKDENVKVKRMSKAILDEFKNNFANLEISER